MLVKCVDLNGEKKPRDECFKAPNCKYYSSEEAYISILKDKEYRNNIMSLVHNLMDYDDTQIVAPYFWKKLKMEVGSYSFQVVYETIQSNEDFIGRALRERSFNGEQHKINFIVKIIANNINDVYNKMKQVDKIKVVDTSDMNMSAINETGKGNTGKDLTSIVDDIWN